MTPTVAPPISTSVRQFRDQGVRFWLEGAALRFEGPLEISKSPEFHALLERQREAVEFLEAETQPIAPLMVKRPIPARTPLSTRQEFFFHSNQDGDCEINRYSYSYRIKGPFHPDIFENALNAVIARNPGLRALYREDKDGAFTILPPETIIKAVQHNVKREEDAGPFMDALHAAPFDLSTGPLVRAQSLKLGAIDTILQIVIHCFAMDPSSIVAFIQDLDKAYDAIAKGEDIEREGASFTHADYVFWERERLALYAKADLDCVWRDKLPLAPPIALAPARQADAEEMKEKGAPRSGPGLKNRFFAFSRQNTSPQETELYPLGGGPGDVSRVSKAFRTSTTLQQQLREFSYRNMAPDGALLLYVLGVVLARPSGAEHCSFSLTIPTAPPSCGPFIGDGASRRPFIVDMSGDPTGEEIAARAGRSFKDIYDFRARISYALTKAHDFVRIGARYVKTPRLNAPIIAPRFPDASATSLIDTYPKPPARMYVDLLETSSEIVGRMATYSTFCTQAQAEAWASLMPAFLQNLVDHPHRRLSALWPD